jgi:hypothetical protein
VRTIKESCLQRMILFGEESLRTAISNLVAHYHSERNHQGLANRLISPELHEPGRSSRMRNARYPREPGKSLGGSPEIPALLTRDHKLGCLQFRLPKFLYGELPLLSLCSLSNSASMNFMNSCLEICHSCPCPSVAINA